MRSRLKSRAAELRARRKRTGDSVVQLPERVIDHVDRIQWPHWETGQPVSGLSVVQRAWLENTRLFRVGEDNQRLGWRELVLKARQVWLTTAVLGCWIDSMIRFPGFRAQTIIHKEAGDILAEIYRRMIFALTHGDTARLCNIARENRNKRIELSNGSAWSITTAGMSEQVAEGLGRGGPVHGLHLTEIGFYKYPELVWSATKATVSRRSGWLIAESSPGKRGEFFEREYSAAKVERGSFDSHYFIPWFKDANKSIPRGTPLFDRFMAPAFAQALEPDDLDKEMSLGLRPEQVAYRRSEFLSEDKQTRDKARRELPEDDDTCWLEVHDDGAVWLQGQAIDALQSGIRDPADQGRLSPTFHWARWPCAPDTFVVAGSDTALRSGKDLSTTCFIDWRTRDVIAAVWGRCLDSEHAEAVEWMAYEQLGLRRTQWIISPERNRGLGFIEQLQDRRIPIFKWQGRAHGIPVTRLTRPAMLALIAEWVEGRRPPWRPQCRIPWSRLVSELSNLVDNDGRVEAAWDAHDDTVFAFGQALYCAELVKPRGWSRGDLPAADAKIERRSRRQMPADVISSRLTVGVEEPLPRRRRKGRRSSRRTRDL